MNLEDIVGAIFISITLLSVVNVGIFIFNHIHPQDAIEKESVVGINIVLAVFVAITSILSCFNISVW